MKPHQGPGHRQKQTNEPDAPQWYIDAYLEALTHGTGIIAIHNGQEPQFIPPSQFPELIEALKQVHDLLHPAKTTTTSKKQS